MTRIIGGRIDDGSVTSFKFTNRLVNFQGADLFSF